MFDQTAIYSISQKEFEKFQELIYQKCGISLADSKRSMLLSRLVRRVRTLQMDNLTTYYNYVTRVSNKAELETMLDLVSTNKTFFFREIHHFEFLKKEIVPALGKSKHLRIWSAACSTGEEPYSIAMTLIDGISKINQWKIKIYASDLSTEALRHAKEGIYSKSVVQDIPEKLVKICLLKGTGENEKQIKLKDHVRSMVTFMHHNLMDQKPPFEALLDVIFCRNVLIYFDKRTQEKLISKFFQHLKPGGFLLIGHSESLQYIKNQLTYILPTVYQKQ